MFFEFCKAAAGALRAFFAQKRNCMAVLAATTLLSAAYLYISAATVKVYDGERVMTVKTFNTDAAAVLQQAGIVTSEYDITELDGQGNVSITRTFEVTLIVEGKAETLYTDGGTVAELLEENGVVYNSETDILNYETDTPLFEGMVIEFTGVDYEYYTEKVTIPAETETVYSTYLYAGTVKTVAGSDGEKTITYRKKLINGTVSETVRVSEEITKKPVAGIKYIGTKTAASSGSVSAGKPSSGSGTYADTSKWVSLLRPSSAIKLDSSGAPIGYKKLLTGIASAYSPDDGRASATGVILKAGYVAVNPKLIPYGSKLYIVTADGSVIYGYAVAADTGGFVDKYPDRIVDLFFESEAEANRFGLKNVKIYVL